MPACVDAGGCSGHTTIQPAYMQDGKVEGMTGYRLFLHAGAVRKASVYVLLYPETAVTRLGRQGCRSPRGQE